MPSTKFNKAYEVVTQPMHFRDVTAVLHQDVRQKQMPVDSIQSNVDAIYIKVAALSN